MYVAKRIPAHVLKQHAGAGMRVIDRKAVKPEPVSKAVDATAVRMDSLEKSVQVMSESNAMQMQSMQKMIDSLPVHDDAPPITGFKLHRDENNWTTFVELVRGKRVMN